jgi:hypothetical protein
VENDVTVMATTPPLAFVTTTWQLMFAGYDADNVTWLYTLVDTVRGPGQLLQDRQWAGLEGGTGREWEWGWGWGWAGKERPRRTSGSAPRKKTLASSQHCRKRTATSAPHHHKKDENIHTTMTVVAVIWSGLESNGEKLGGGGEHCSPPRVQQYGVVATIGAGEAWSTQQPTGRTGTALPRTAGVEHGRKIAETACRTRRARTSTRKRVRATRARGRRADSGTSGTLVPCRTRKAAKGRHRNSKRWRVGPRWAQCGDVGCEARVRYGGVGVKPQREGACYPKCQWVRQATDGGGGGAPMKGTGREARQSVCMPRSSVVV